MHKHSSGMRMVITGLIFLAVLLLSSAPTLAQGERVINEDINKAVGDLEIQRGTTVNGDVTLNVGELTVLGIVNGDINSNMGQVTINGDVNGDVETNMGQVIVAGSVSGNVKTRMGEVVINGSVGGDLDTDLGAALVDGSVGGSIGSGFGEMLINGIVGGDVYSRGGKVTVNGVVDGDVVLDRGVVELGPNATVAGRVYVAQGQVNKAPSASAGSVEVGEEFSPDELEAEEVGPGYRFEGIDDNFIGSITDRVTREINRATRNIGFFPEISREWSFYRFPFLGLYGSTARNVINMLILFALAALTYTLFPAQTRRAGEALPAKTGPVIGWGILAAVLAVPLMVLLAITIIGIPLIIVEVVFFAVAAIFGYTGLALLIGERVTRAASSRPANPLGSIAIGALIIGLIGMIPILGGLVTLVVFVFAVGITLVTRFGSAGSEPTAALPAGKPDDSAQ